LPRYYTFYDQHLSNEFFKKRRVKKLQLPKAAHLVLFRGGSKGAATHVILGLNTIFANKELDIPLQDCFFKTVFNHRRLGPKYLHIDECRQDGRRNEHG
jgi:hypothetical protein